MQHSDVVGEARYERPAQHAPPEGRGLPDAPQVDATQAPPRQVPSQQLPGSVQVAPSGRHASERHTPDSVPEHENPAQHEVKIEHDWPSQPPATHDPLVHTWPVAQARPQAPQFVVDESAASQPSAGFALQSA